MLATLIFCSIIRLLSWLNDLLHTMEKWPLATMYVLMCLQIILKTEWHITHITSQCLFPPIYIQWHCFILTLNTEWFIKQITTQWPVPNMYTLMMVQVTLISECLVLMVLQRTRTIELLLTTPHSSMATPHYACPDAASDYSDHWMFSFIYHNKITAHQYVSADESSNCCDEWMTYYMCHSKVAAD